MSTDYIQTVAALTGALLMIHYVCRHNDRRTVPCVFVGIRVFWIRCRFSFGTGASGGETCGPGPGSGQTSWTERTKTSASICRRGGMLNLGSVLTCGWEKVSLGYRKALCIKGGAPNLKISSGFV